MGKTAEDLRSDLEQQRESIGRDLVAIGDRVSPGRMVDRRRLAVRQSFARAREAVMGARDTATGTTQHAASVVGDAVTSAPQAIQSQTQGNPLAAGLVAFGMGALAGTLLPTTRREEEAVAQVQPALETAAGELAGSAQSVAASAKEHAAEGAEQLKSTVKDAADSIKSDVQEVAGPGQAGPADHASRPSAPEGS
jgi:hypothetical protein